jgi:hypothetical protein
MLQVHYTGTVHSRVTVGPKPYQESQAAWMMRICHPRSGYMADFDIFECAEESEDLEQIDHHRNHGNRIQDAFDFAVHRNVGAYEPEKISDNDQHADDINETH